MYITIVGPLIHTFLQPHSLMILILIKNKFTSGLMAPTNIYSSLTHISLDQVVSADRNQDFVKTTLLLIAHI